MSKKLKSYSYMERTRKKSRNHDKPTWWIVLSNIGFWFFLLSFLVFASERFWQSFFMLLIALILHPRIHFSIEKVLRIRYTWLAKIISFMVLFSCLIVAAEKYDQKEALYKAKLETERIEKEQREQQRLDSLNYYYQRSIQQSDRKRYRQAIKEITRSIEFAEEGKDSLARKRAEWYMKTKQYALAIADYSILIDHYKVSSEYYYNRARCYLKIKEKQEAVDDLRSAMRYGSKKANKLYEQVNPERKRVAYYVTRCCDGSTSSAKGRGACSHHRGVCSWNDPVYQTYRKY